MALNAPPAASVNRFEGGYRSRSSYTTLGDSQTNDAENTVYSPTGQLTQRLGMSKILDTMLSDTSSTATGEPINGHYFFTKTGTTSSFHVVQAGNSIYRLTTTSSTAIANTITADSETFMHFAQIQDPESASDDVIIMTNGVDPVKIWNGTDASASNLSAVAGSSGVPAAAKFVIAHKNRIYLANITDPTDVDSVVRIDVSGFGGDGAPDPHVFADSFFVGGSDRGGPIKNLKTLNDQIIIYKRNSIFKFTPGVGRILDTSTLQEMEANVGLFAENSLVDAGNFHIFLSEKGVFAFDGVNIRKLSKDVDDDIFQNSNRGKLMLAKATFDKQRNQYKLYYPFSGSTQNNRGLIFDLDINAWQPPVTGRRINFASTFDDSDGIERTLLGDYSGFVYQDDTGNNDGAETGFNGMPTAGSLTSLSDSTQSFPTDGDGLAGVLIKIISGTGIGQERVISSNTEFTVIVPQWDTPPDTTSEYTIGAIDANWKSKDYELGNHDIVKLFRHIRTRTREEGNQNLTLEYIIDFRNIQGATSVLLSQLGPGLTWGTSTWGSARWGKQPTITNKVSLRNTALQRTNGTHIALRFSNRRANETFLISGYDIESKRIGKR